VQEHYGNCFGTHHCRRSRDSNRCHSGQFKTAIGGRKSAACHENGCLPLLSVTCFLSGCFDGSRQHVWNLDNSRFESSASRPLSGNQGAAFGLPRSARRRASRRLSSWGQHAAAETMLTHEQHQSRLQQHHVTKNTTAQAVEIRTANVSGVTSHSMGNGVSRPARRIVNG